jgi:hypothetical protein
MEVRNGGRDRARVEEGIDGEIKGGTNLEVG